MDLQQIFDPAVFGPPLLGGGLIGLAAALMAVGMGRVTGVSGIAAGALRFQPGEWGWRAAFLAGLIAAPLIYGGFDAGWADTGPLPSLALLAGAGLLVGIGAGVGSGCTSGHGVCGLARLSPRSMVATAVFMATAAATVFVMRHLIGG